MRLSPKMLGPSFPKSGNKKNKYIIQKKKKILCWHFLKLVFESGEKKKSFDGETKQIINVNYIWGVKKKKKNWF